MLTSWAERKQVADDLVAVGDVTLNKMDSLRIETRNGVGKGFEGWTQRE